MFRQRKLETMEKEDSLSLNDLRQWKKSGKKIAIHGKGNHGMLFFQLLKKWGIQIDCFLDNSLSKQKESNSNAVFCISPKQVDDKTQMLVLVCVSWKFFLDISKELKTMGFLYVFSPFGIVDDILLHFHESYFDIFREEMNFPEMDAFYCINSVNKKKEIDKEVVLSSERIAAYTAVFGDYDSCFSPHVHPGNIDYFYVSDNSTSPDSGFQWLNARDVIPDWITSPIQRNRYAKMHPHLLFPDYRYSIYIDGNIEIVEDISDFVKQSRSGISVFMHPAHDCIYYEALTIVSLRRVARNDVVRQMKRYLEEGMPIHYGMPEMSVIAREHSNPLCVRLMGNWWEEFCHGAQRDQLSFSYILWKNGIGIQDISSLGNDIRQSPKLFFHPHERKSRFIRLSDE